MKFTKKSIYIGLFSILYLIVAFSSFFHACAFFGLANNSWMSVILAFAFEVGQAAVLFSLLTSKKDRSRIMPWVLMAMFTLVQVIGNVYSSYKYIITNSVDNLRYFKEPIFIWTDLPDAQANVIIVYLVGALLPIASLLLTSMITNYLTDNDEEQQIKLAQLQTEKGPENQPIILNNKEDFDKVYNKENDSLINQNSILQMENQGLQESNDKKNEEINKLKQELEELKNAKINQKIVDKELKDEIKESKSNNDDGKFDMETTRSETSTESKTTENIEQEVETTELEGDKSDNDNLDKIDESDPQYKTSRYYNGWWNRK